MSFVEGLDNRLISAHLDDEIVFGDDVGRVGAFDSRGVLEGSHTAAVDRFALGEKIWKFLSSSLCRSHPAQGHRGRLRSVVDTNRFNCVGESQVFELHRESLSNGWVQFDGLELESGDWLRVLAITEVLGCVGWHEFDRVNIHVPNVQDNLVSHRNSHEVMGNRASDRFAIEVNGDVHVEMESEQLVNVGEGGVVH